MADHSLKLSRSLVGRERDEAMTTKLLQSSQRCAMYIEVLGRPTSIMMNTICPLQYMSSSSAPCTKRAVLYNCSVSPSAQLFGDKMRRVTTDAAASDRVVEKSVAKDRGAGGARCITSVTSTLRVGCARKRSTASWAKQFLASSTRLCPSK
eukprot:7364028-Pyramimonas_sp.AAC.1